MQGDWHEDLVGPLGGRQDKVELGPEVGLAQGGRGSGARQTGETMMAVKGRVASQC